MNFKEFIKNEELIGLFGGVKPPGKPKEVKLPSGMGKGDTIKRMQSSGPKVTKPARPAGPGAGLSSPMTIPSVLK